MAYLTSYKELIVWQKSMSLAVQVFEITTKFPKSETYGLVSQLRRSAVSIPSNIAEGYGRRTKKEFTQFLRIAYGSSLELETQLILSRKLSFIAQAESEIALALLQEVSKMLNSMITKLSKLQKVSLDAKR